MSAEPGPLSCEEVDNLAAAWSLDALPPAEAAAVDEHLLSCATGHPLLAELAEAASLVGRSAGEVMPPAGLRDQIFAAAGLRPAGDELRPDRATPRPTPLPTRWWVAVSGIAAALAAVAIGLGAWGAGQHTQLVNQRAAGNAQSVAMANALTALSTGGSLVRTGAQGTLAPVLLIQPSDGSAAYALVTWQPAPRGKSYQAWFIKPGENPVSAGVFSGSPAGVEVLRLSGPIAGVQTFAVTIEPAGGSLQPTTQPVLASGIPS